MSDITVTNSPASQVTTQVEDYGVTANGARFGATSTSKIGFYGLTTPIVKPTGAAQAAVATTVITTAAITTTTNAYGYADTTQANNIAAIADGARTLANALRTALVNLGLIAGA